MTSGTFDFWGLLLGHWDMLSGRNRGPLSLRILVQPLVATAFGLRAGYKDARASQAPYGWLVATRSELRGVLLREGWSHVGIAFLAAATIDVIYELLVFRWIYPVQALIVATILAALPYALVRGLSNRLFRLWLRRPHRISASSHARTNDSEIPP
jgi:hypothetical protein